MSFIILFIKLPLSSTERDTFSMLLFLVNISSPEQSYIEFIFFIIVVSILSLFSVFKIIFEEVS